jgi:hypothetical protein
MPHWQSHRHRDRYLRGSPVGRGRQKAKHTKVARDLKYFSPDTNYDSLAKELGNTPPGDPRLAEDLEKWPEFAGSVEPDYSDPYADDAFEADDADESKSA